MSPQLTRLVDDSLSDNVFEDFDAWMGAGACVLDTLKREVDTACRQ